MHKKRSWSSTFLYAGLCIVALWGIHRYGASTKALEHISSYVMYPILVAQNKIVMPIKQYFERNRSRKEIEDLLSALQHERDDLVAQNVQLNAMLSYTKETKELVDFKKQFESVDARITQVLVKHFSDQSHYFLIDKGSNAGMAPDMVAIYKNCLLGKVIEVYPQYSKVLLVTDSLCKVAAYCAHTQASGIHEGKNNEMLTGIRYISHLAQVEADDLVLSSGDGLIFPKGFALGKIKTCNPEGLFYDVTIEPLLDLRKIDYCFIIQKGAVLNESAISHMLITLTEEHDLQNSQQKTDILASKNNIEPIHIAQDFQDKLTITNNEIESMNHQELVQQQRLAAQSEMELAEHMASHEQLGNPFHKITL
ncbi:MAG: rod shape-determining protein MreC [Candidatus Babeliales bacterium]|nr:rod shape-determining protein MreC [Candidatus Babeliales bacterium]